ncbi:MAG: hypothetical protein ACK5L0_04290 [Candidatus Fimivivens sp.]
MKLILQGWRIALRHSLGAMLSILACLALFFTAVFAILNNAPTPDPVKLAVISLDGDARSATLLSSIMTANLKGVATVTLLEPDENTDDYAAVLTLPQGFWHSVMTGENLAPALTVNVSSPLEGLWIRQLAQSAGRTLLNSQSAIGSLLSAMSAEQLSNEDIDQKLFSANMTLMESYMTRKGLFDSHVLHATGEVSVTEYYGGAAVSFVFFSLLFLLFPPLYMLRRFGGFSQRRHETFVGCALTAITLFAILCPLGILALGAPIQNAGRISCFVLVLFCASLLTFCAAVFSSTATCAAAVTGLAWIQALVGGGLLPAALLPPALAPLSRLLPLSLMRRLTIDAAFGAGFSDTGIALLWSILLTGSAFLLWSRKAGV